MIQNIETIVDQNDNDQNQEPKNNLYRRINGSEISHATPNKRLVKLGNDVVCKLFI